MNISNNIHSQFIKEFNKIYRKSDWMTPEEFAPLFELFKIDQENNEIFIVDELEKYSIVRGDEYLSRYYRIMGFILYLGINEGFKNEKINTILKGILDYIASGELPERYGFTLKTLFSVNKFDHQYYIDQYSRLKNEGKLYHDINEEFLGIFITHKNNELFLDSFQQNIIDNVIHVHISLEIGFEYLLNLNDEDFKVLFLRLLAFFDRQENKFKLIHHHEYNSLIRTYNKERFVHILTDLGEKIQSSGFTDAQINEIKNFIINDIDFAIEKHARKLSEIVFINSIFQTFHKKDKSFLLDVLRGIKSKYIALSINTFIVEYLDISQIEDIIQIYKGGESELVLYFVYDEFVSQKNEEFVARLNNSSMKKEFIKRNKIISKNQEKYEEKEKKQQYKEKAIFLSMLNPCKGEYYPKLFQDYVLYLKKDGGLLSLFTRDEVEKINKSVQEQIITYLEGVNIINYSDPKIQKILTFENKESNSYIHTQNSVFLGWILDIAKSIQFDLSEYYRCYVLFFPLLWGSEKIKETLEMLSGLIKKQDIDYILRVYSEDIHDNAKDLRYFHIDSITEFYQKFKDDFSNLQKKKLMEISLGVIYSEQEDNIYTKDKFLQIYSEIGGKRKLEALFHGLLEIYPNYNYFKDVLDGSEVKKEESDKKKFIMFIARELCRVHSSKPTALWAIKQVREGRIEVIDMHQIKYPYTFGTITGMSEKESEFRWGSDSDSFAYIFGLLEKVDVVDEMLELLDYSFKTQKELYSGGLKGEYESYCYYIRNIFYKYIKTLNKEYINKEYYAKIEEILNRYEHKIVYNFQIGELQGIFGVDIEEEAKTIISDSDVPKLIEILKINKKLIEENSKLTKDNQELNQELGERPEKDKNTILFVEGIADKIILTTAWIKLYGDREIPFRIEIGHGCSFLKRGFTDDYGILDSNEGKICIGMLDFDEAFKEYTALTKDWEVKESDELIGLLKKHGKKNGYIFLLPVPLSRKNIASKIIGDKSLLSIEFLFKDSLLLIKNNAGGYKYVEEIFLPGSKRGKLFKFTKNKVEFARNTLSFNKQDFSNFKTIFDLIDKIIDGKYVADLIENPPIA